MKRCVSKRGMDTFSKETTAKTVVTFQKRSVLTENFEQWVNALVYKQTLFQKGFGMQDAKQEITKIEK